MYSITLTDESGETCDFEDMDIEELSNFVVGVEIIGCKKVEDGLSWREYVDKVNELIGAEK